MKRLSRQTLEQILIHSSEGIVVSEARAPDYPVIFVNPAFETRSGMRAADLLGQPLPWLDRLSLPESETARLRAVLDRHEADEIAVNVPDQGNESFTDRLRIEPLYDARGALQYLMLAQVPTAEELREERRTEAERSLGPRRPARRVLATMDLLEPATGILRYEHFEELAERDFRVASRDGRRVALILFEVVDLDVYRQTFGNKAADSCLRMIATQVSGALRRTGGLCARADGQGIVALIHDRDMDDVRSVALHIAGNVRGLGLHNPRGRYGRYIQVQLGIAGGVPDERYMPNDALTEARENLGSVGPFEGARVNVGA